MNLMSLEYWVGYIVAGVTVGVTIHFLQLLMNIYSRIGVAENKINTDFEKRFDNIEKRFDTIDQHLKDIDQDIRDLKERTARVEQNLQDLPQQLVTLIQKELADFEKRQIQGGREQ
ncbi:hypothetical protein [Thermococcus sp.]|uniref:hypothetical protein n=1 Tax=Thermococcus sp. TaxID=35749 RepID=UPI0025E70D6E|nr:hypothetical protein [Thermococcus sp.]